MISLVKKSRICSSFVVLQLLKGMQSFKLDTYVKGMPFVNSRGKQKWLSASTESKWNRGGTLGISEWRCAAGTLEPLTG